LARKLPEDPTVRGTKARGRKAAAMRCQLYSSSLTKPLGELVDAYKTILRDLHPFEEVITNLIFTKRVKEGRGDLEDALDGIRWVRRETSTMAKAAAGASAKTTSQFFADETFEGCLKEVRQMWEQNSHKVKTIRDIGRELRRIPVVDPSMPTAVLVGSPNVGKSSLVRKISTGTPEVRDYPFTTRGMTMGHVMDPIMKQRACQVMDTPGLLPREDTARNHMELLTLACVQFLPSQVVFVLDLTGGAGAKSAIESQLAVREELRERFPWKSWIDVLSKADLPREAISPELERRLPLEAIAVSCQTGEGVEEFRSLLFERIPGLGVPS